MHKTMVLGTQFCIVVSYEILNMSKKYIKSRTLDNKPNGKSFVFYLGGVRFKS